ncbi:NUDIX hydrolase [Candidatus Marsarchaeota archaeon]|jgi:8-oxo-dGTP pyrophosphatase MutT (NUDIX family)|nr:NUDIX hydrolase [Candidatus Marsarchaeota archaeon]
MEEGSEVDVAFVVVVTRDGVVYLKRNEDDDIEPGKWCLPSGHVESGEKYVSAAVRELYEETGIRAKPDELEHLGTFPYLLDGTKFRVWLYLVEKSALGAGDVRVFEEEHSGKRCIGIEALAAMHSLRDGEKFTGIDEHIIMNYVPEVASKINRVKESAGINISRSC